MNQQFRMVKQLIDMQKAFCDGMIDNLMMMWEQTRSILEAATWFPEEGRKAFRQWVEINKSGCENLKTAVDSGYAGLEKFFDASARQ